MFYNLDEATPELKIVNKICPKNFIMIQWRQPKTFVLITSFQHQKNPSFFVNLKLSTVYVTIKKHIFKAECPEDYKWKLTNKLINKGHPIHERTSWTLTGRFYNKKHPLWPHMSIHIFAQNNISILNNKIQDDPTVDDVPVYLYSH